ncbi:MAG: tktB, partial [Acidobacteria bacterium]|nr:tktB [Acidobacteriota bacterium]
MTADRATLIRLLHNAAVRLRIESIRSTTAAGSGHPTTCMSAAEIVAVLFFAEMRFDPADPRGGDNDRFVLSKGHAAPLLYAAWAEAGAFDRAELLNLRRIDSDLEGHPTPRLPFVDVATGSLGQGLAAGIGMALDARRTGSSHRTYVLMGDGESLEGSVWEAAAAAEYFHLDTLCGITDVNGLGQSQATRWGHDLDAIGRCWQAFGWEVVAVDGHDVAALLDAFARAREAKGRPTMILARTIKGKGVAEVEGREGWHGVPFKPDLEKRAIAELEARLLTVPGGGQAPGVQRPVPSPRPPAPSVPADLKGPTYRLGDQVATREAFGQALVKLGAADPRVVALDADVRNSTFSDAFAKAYPDRFYEAFIAEQVMVGMAMGMASHGAIPFPSTFACFLTRAADFIRMAAISNLNVKFVGSHAGVSIGEDGPSQMGLEDLAMMRAQPNVTVLYPCDGVSTERLVAEAAAWPGPVYIRTSRPKTPVLYGADEAFPVGGSKVLRQSASDVATVVAAGVTVYEALKACEALALQGVPIRVIDAYSVQPIDGAALKLAASQTGGIVITVEDHYVAGGLGDAAAAALSDVGVAVRRLAVREIPRSGPSGALLDRFGISAGHIVAAVLEATGGGR